MRAMSHRLPIGCPEPRRWPTLHGEEFKGSSHAACQLHRHAASSGRKAATTCMLPTCCVAQHPQDPQRPQQAEMCGMWSMPRIQGVAAGMQPGPVRANLYGVSTSLCYESCSI
mmetsp:Transcript_31981/g.101786  ORF Transcript_31981/g.101786 Transcript_31981/m.101786 type:complete len:113 (-) Transcript_31981:396-734(-)